MLAVDAVKVLLISATLAAEPAPSAPEATLQVANRAVFTFRATSGGIPPAERLALARSRVEGIPPDQLGDEVSTRPLQVGSEKATAIFHGPRFLFQVAEGDVDPAAGETTASVAKKTAAALQQALQAQQEQRSIPLLFRGLIRAGIATAVMAALVWVLVRGRRLVAAGILRATRSPETWKRWGVDFTPFVRSFLKGVQFLTFWALLLALLEVWLTYVLSRFPATRPWSEALLGGVLSLLGKLAGGVVRAIPDLVAAILILLAGRAVAGFVGGVFRRVEAGTASIPGVHPATAGATRRIAVALVWLVALAAAYPYLPGSGSDAFKGLSLLVGLVLSLGSTGVVAQGMSGLVLIYSRALARGDCVQVGTTEGVVTEVTLLSTRILTIQGEEVTLPNAVVVNGAVKNFGGHTQGRGALISARVSIGYDAQWRQVHALLLQAARETRGLRPEPVPYVLQRGLDDFYVVYELVAVVVDPVQRPLVASELHARIQDAFNAAGVQIMSPHFVLQPRKPVLGPAPPAEGGNVASDRGAMPRPAG